MRVACEIDEYVRERQQILGLQQQNVACTLGEGEI